MITFPRKFYDGAFRKHLKSSKISEKYITTETDKAQYSFNVSILNPNDRRLLPFPLSITIDDIIKKESSDNPINFYIKEDSALSYGVFTYEVSSKNLKKPIRNSFWVVNVLNTSSKIFFSKEKKFLHLLMKNHKYNNRIIEIHNIDKLKISDGISLQSELSPNDITYSFFPYTLLEPKIIKEIPNEGLESD